jgi:ribosome-associated translation inhibitor RaiA
MARTQSFQKKIPRAAKLRTGRGGVAETPLNVRTIGTASEEGLGEHVRSKLGRKLGKFAPSIERVSVRFEDVNGPRGGVDHVSRIKVVLSDLPSVIVESTGTDATHAFDTASHRVERAVQRNLGRAGVSQRPRPSARKAAARPLGRAPNAPPKAGSLVGRRVGQADENIEAAIVQRRGKHVDTSAPGVSATARKAGGGSTAARNVSKRARKATARLEDSATGKPSRKSTRGSAGRAKAGSKQRRAAVRTARSPKRKATKAQAARAGR